MVTILFLGGYRQGDFILKSNPIKLKNHSYLQRSIVWHNLGLATKSVGKIISHTLKVVSSMNYLDCDFIAIPKIYINFYTLSLIGRGPVKDTSFAI